MAYVPENAQVSLTFTGTFDFLTLLVFCAAIDEEFVSQLKLVEADMKRMSGILVSYEEQKPDLKKHEKDERLAVIKCLKEALRILKDDFEQ